jgi:hypothetical protein
MIKQDALARFHLTQVVSRLLISNPCPIGHPIVNEVAP